LSSDFFYTDFPFYCQHHRHNHIINITIIITTSAIINFTTITVITTNIVAITTITSVKKIIIIITSGKEKDRIRLSGSSDTGAER